MNTEIEIPVSELKSALPGLAKIVPRSSNLPVLQCIKVSLDPEQKTISLQAHNLDEVATFRTANKANGLSGEALVPLDLLTKLVKGCSADQAIRIIATENETKVRYAVAGSYVDRSVTHVLAQDWPEMKTINSEPIPLDNDFKIALREALECSSSDSSRYVLNGTCLDVRDKDAHYVVGSDGRHLYSANSFHFALPESLIVPGRKFISWPGFINDGPWKLRMLPAVKAPENASKEEKAKEEPAWFLLESDRWSYLARAIDGNFPSWKQVVPIPERTCTRITLQKGSIDMMLDSVPLLPGNEETNQGVTIVAGNGLVLRARGRDQQDWTSVAVPESSVVGKATKVTLNRNYLTRALRFGLNRMEIGDSMDPVVFCDDRKTMVVMPLRFEGPVEPPSAQTSTASGTEPVSATPPSAAEATTMTEERKTMSSTTTTTTMAAPERGNLKTVPANSNGNGQNGSEETRSAFKSAAEHIDRVRTSLRDVVADLSDALALLKSAEKEQRATAKEIEAFRTKLRELQKVEI